MKKKKKIDYRNTYEQDVSPTFPSKNRTEGKLKKNPPGYIYWLMPDIKIDKNLTSKTVPTPPQDIKKNARAEY